MIEKLEISDAKPLPLFSSAAFAHTRLDYSHVAKKIVAECATELQCVRAIYDWITDTVEYDTSFTIFHADECWRQRSGVCQAYCELFVEIARTIGIEVKLITGKTKHPVSGEVESSLHAWLLFENLNDRGYLIDPTWGAGYVKDGRFSRALNTDIWWDVDPNMFIFTHFTPDFYLQQLYLPITEKEWNSLPPLSPESSKIGLRGGDILSMARKHKGDFEFPRFYYGIYGKLKVLEIPLEANLTAGKNYVFRILSNHDIVIIESGEVRRPDRSAANVLTWNFKPTKSGDLYLAELDGNTYRVLISYKVKPLSFVQRLEFERNNPWTVPEVISAAGGRAQVYDQLGFKGVKVLSGVRNGAFVRLPELLDADSGVVKVISVPYSRVLRVGERYVFCVKLLDKSRRLALFQPNRSKWHFGSNGSPVDTFEIEFIPECKGDLHLMISMPDTSEFKSLLRYNIL